MYTRTYRHSDSKVWMFSLNPPTIKKDPEKYPRYACNMEWSCKFNQITKKYI